MSAGAVDEQELILLFGCCCCGTYLYCDDCLGCSGKETYCCLETAFCCKVGTSCLACGCCHREDKILAIGCGFCEIACIRPTTCCKDQSQMCCLANQSAFPCDDDQPVVCAAYGLACIPGCGCCQTLGALMGKNAQKNNT